MADGSIVTVSAPGGRGPRVAMVDADGVRPLVLAAGEGHHGGASGLDDMRLLARGVEGTFWLLHFVTYRAEQYHLTSGDLLQSIHREVPWLTTGSGAGDWRYASLLDAHQLSADRLWVLGRSLDPAYTAASRASAESPLAGRQAAWDLQLDLLSLPGGDVVASLTLPYWVGGFTSDGLLYFFDEVEGDRGRIVVTRLRLESDSNFSP